MLKNFWDNRYSGSEYVYGTEPNQFFKNELGLISSPGKILLPMEGEGRNAVYAARQGWDVTAFDQSESGRYKAMKLAGKFDVTIKYMVMNAEDFECPAGDFDMVAMIYAHMPRSLRTQLHHKVSECLGFGGKIILEAFNKEQLGKSSGGPQSLKALYSAADLEKDFSDLEIVYLEELEINLDEGSFHRGTANVIRMIAEKI